MTGNSAPVFLCANEEEAEQLALRGLNAICPAADAPTQELYEHRGAIIVVTPRAKRERAGVAAVLHAAGADVREFINSIDIARDDLLKAPTARIFQAPNAPADERIKLTRADDLQVERIRWLWDGYLARRKLHLFAGPPGVNKTTAALAIAATLSIGGRWPDGTEAPKGSTVIWSGEDGIQDTLLPRLIALGAALDRIHFVRDISDEDGVSRPFDPSRDMDELTRATLRIDDLALAIVDPVVLTVKGDSNTNGDVRRGLLPVQVLAERTGAAAIGVTHFSKGTAGKSPIERVTGSLAFGAAARIVHVFARLPEDQGGGRAMLRAKSNIGPDGGGFAFDVQPVDVAGGQTIRLLWRGPISGDAHDILSAAERIDDPEERAALDETSEFLRSILIDGGGSMDRKEIVAAGRRAGYSERSLERAKARCSISAKSSGFGRAKHSVWSLFDDHSRQHPPSKIVGDIGVIGGNGDGNEREEGTLLLNSANSDISANTASVRACARDGGNGAEHLRYRSVSPGTPSLAARIQAYASASRGE